MAGLLALGAAACGDDVEIVQPTPEPPPPPPPVTATMAPASAEVAVGNSVVFAVNASGGVAGDAASWTCASSNTGIATVTSTSAGCSATGVAAGDVTITASVTKSGETVNVGAQLTVTSDEEPPAPPGDPAFILIQSITGDGESDASGLTGRVDVKVGVERGDQELEELSLLLDGAVVASQSFGGGMDMGMGMTPPEEAAEQAVHEFTLSFDSDDYDRDTGAPVYANGEYTISAELEIGVDMADGTHGHETISSNAVPVEFKNSSFIAASVTGLGDGAMNAVTGQVWYGGPDASVEISALPVLYSGSVSSVTLNQFCGDAAATDSEAPFSFEVDCGGFQGSDTPSFNVGGSVMTSKGGKVYLDFKAPDAPDFQPNPNGREDGWVNASVGFTAKWEDKKGKMDGWLLYNDDSEDNDADDGVGGYTPQIRFAESGDDNEVGGALAAPALTQLVLPASLAGKSSKEDHFCVVVSAVDLLGNESKLPDADADCESADGYEAGDAGLLAGVDLQAPTIKFSSVSPEENGEEMRDFQVQLADEGSGIRGASPLKASVNLRDKDDDEKVDPLGLSVSLPLATTTGLPDGVGYYTFTASVTDKAGNSSAETTRTAVHDDMPPVVSTIVGEYNEKTGEYTLVATVTDNLSIKEYWPEMRYEAAVAFGANLILADPLLLPREDAVPVDAYNATTLTQATLASSLKAHAYRAIQHTAGTGIANLASISVFASDHGGGMSAAPAAPTDPTPTDLTIADNGFDISADAIAQGTLTAPTPATAADSRVFQSLATTFADSTVSKGGTVEIIVTATGTSGFVAPIAPSDTIDDATTTGIDESAGAEGTQGLRDNPLSRVDIYAAVERDGGGGDDALKFIGSIAGSAAAVEDFDSDPATDPAANDSRRFIYTMEMSAPDFLAIVGGKGNYTGDIVAFGVRDNKGVAFATAAEDLVVNR